MDSFVRGIITSMYYMSQVFCSESCCACCHCFCLKSQGVISSGQGALLHLVSHTKQEFLIDLYSPFLIVSGYGFAYLQLLEITH